jgi:alkyl sulfatase BDS1-like metallo-beta-lactamase superfamily hydrolase
LPGRSALFDATRTGIPRTCPARRALRPGSRRSHLPQAPARPYAFDSLAISVNGPDAWDLELSLNVTFTDIDTNYRLTLRNGVLIHVARPADDTADATLTVTKGRMLGLLAGDTSSPGIDIAGDTQRP